MKPNEAPKKIQIHLVKNDYDAWNVRGYSFLEDKQLGMTEYIRRDAFIEKACEWLSDNLQTIRDVDSPSEHHVETIPALGSITQTEFFRKVQKGNSLFIRLIIWDST